ncbi:hypothetical protein L1987_09585 [Smallanthus sonchifolius]|uniref:Uncharacterized protein n=1 Tax=Smallanthus sonchifolius TaxID=185202 RepID=A0ACB9JP51_9ASTR|nr:hypothetical protein L1987_09585 [Smallanthus sonchifolius]
MNAPLPTCVGNAGERSTSSNAPKNRGTRHTLYNTRMCTKFAYGNWRNGDVCTFVGLFSNHSFFFSSIICVVSDDMESGNEDQYVGNSALGSLMKREILTVKPVLNRLKNTLVALAISLFMFIVLLINTETTQKETYITSGGEAGGRSVAGSYNDESARSFEPEAFCGGSDPSFDD